ncbi:MAG: L-serine ammonia-lyase, iron-sulfur-dependent, subunit alpha [Limnochordia bacterium]|jgi:L-cysteine desulfidase|nr:L-serine ammonia-lyase, iron-sulfur-dependent, subunit alpha [Limnochordia bacterium]
MCIDVLKYENYVAILQEELVPAIGCTEPACLALAGAKLKEVLGEVPDKLHVRMSGNLIKNTKSVIIPHSNGLKGIVAALWLGIFGGEVGRGLAVLGSVGPEDIEATKERLSNAGLCQVELLESPAKLHLIVAGSTKQSQALVEILHTHTGFVRIERDGEVLLNKEVALDEAHLSGDRSLLNVSDILSFARSVRLEDVEPILRPQIQANSAIAEVGLREDYGANVGKVLMDNFGTAVGNVARATAAAASDARMDGCQLPVVINSGSGNQGIAASIPVMVYARYYGLSDEELLRALCVSNLVAIHQKTSIGRLSAYCGAVSAACGSGAAIAYMLGGDYDEVSDTITNTLANVAGILCDGAKPSCAAKIASSVDAAVMGLTMSFSAIKFLQGDGIVKSDVEETIAVVGDIASKGMRQTDITVIQHMIN